MSFIKSILSFFTKNNEQPQENINPLNTSNVNSITKSTAMPQQHIIQIDILDILNNLEKGQKTASKPLKPMFHSTYEEERLSAKFLWDNQEYLHEKQGKMIDLNKKANETITDVDVTISYCKKAIKAFYDLKNECYQTKGGMIYFQDIWEHCHNSQNPCFCFIEKTEKRLQDLTENYAERKKYYERRQYAMKHLKNDLITLISNHENILQKDIYSHFDADLKDNVARMLYDMDKKGEIKRVKHGSTYQLSIK